MVDSVAFRLAVIDEVNDHRHAERVGQQDNSCRLALHVSVSVRN
jgi:hypothetical protein